MTRIVAAVVSVAVCLTLGCGAAAPADSPTSAKLASGSSVETYFPLEDGRLYAYETNDSGDKGMLVAKVHRADALHGELQLSNGTKRFVFAPGSVAYDNGAVILKAPLEVGATWPGEHGGTTHIATVDAAPKVIAGSYTSCVQTIEEGGRIPGAKFTTTYCPGVGMVLLEVEAAGSHARAELKSYGPPVKIE